MAKPFYRPFRRLKTLKHESSGNEEIGASTQPDAVGQKQLPNATPPPDEVPFRDLAERGGVSRAPKPLVERVRPPAQKRSRIAGDVESAGASSFSVRSDGEHVVGLRDGVPDSLLDWLQDQEPDGTLDLHGMTAEVARRALHRFLRARWKRGHRVLLVITGRGLRSAAGPVLRDGTIEWLTESAVAQWVCAFESAPSERGGSGAILVLLDRP